MRPRFLQTKKTLAYRTVGMYHGPNSWGDGIGLGFGMVIVGTVYVGTRWGVSDLLHYQAYCSKARKEGQTEREGERRDRGKGRLALEHSAMSPDQPFPTGRVCMGRHGGGSFLGMHQSVRLGTDASVGFSHPRTLHARRVRVACLLFVHQTLPVFLCVCLSIPCRRTDGRTVSLGIGCWFLSIIQLPLSICCCCCCC